MARAAIETLLQMATPASRQALEALSQSSDEKTSDLAKDALSRFK